MKKYKIVDDYMFIDVGDRDMIMYFYSEGMPVEDISQLIMMDSTLVHKVIDRISMYL